MRIPHGALSKISYQGPPSRNLLRHEAAGKHIHLIPFLLLVSPLLNSPGLDAMHAQANTFRDCIAPVRCMHTLC